MSSSRAPSTPTDVNGLRIFIPTGQDAFQDLRPDSLVFNCTAAVISLALDLLSCRASVSALKKTARRIIETHRNEPHLRDITDFEGKVNEFLYTIRRSFPHVVITNRRGMATMNGRTNKLDCSGTFEPKTAAVIELNETLMNQMAEACRVLRARPSESNQHHFRTLHFRLSITMAHELVHVFNLFFRRRRQAHTPPHVTYGGFGNTRVGESGRFWEYQTFGGFVDMRENTALRMVAVAIRDSHGQHVWRIKNAVVDGILRRDFNKWLRPDEPLNDEDHPKGVLTEYMPTINWKNKYSDIFPPSLPSEQNAELSAGQISSLTSLKALQNFPKYNMSGPDLRAFVSDPRPSIRQAVAM